MGAVCTRKIVRTRLRPCESPVFRPTNLHKVSDLCLCKTIFTLENYIISASALGIVGFVPHFEIVAHSQVATVTRYVHGIRGRFKGRGTVQTEPKSRMPRNRENEKASEREGEKAH